ncbi:MAG: hypothetical protein OEW50_09325 [Gammaproteobacteria bacterium]|nr:hypothetical protein [Gammaproteobacteria bacterium]
MASSRKNCSSTLRAPRTNPPWPEAATLRAAALAASALLVAACGHADTSPPAPPAAATGKPEVLCAPSPAGFLRARLQGAIEAELDWSAPTTAQCLGGTRPQGDGLRLVYKGEAGGAPLLIVIGIATLARDTPAARNVPANVTLVREGAGAFYSTQGDDKCALDEVRQEPVTGHAGRYRLSARGYCTQPARALGGDGAVLVTRFDAEALVDYPPEQQ